LTLAERLLVAADPISREVMEAFYARHPDWRERYGPAGYQRGLEDTVFHMRFLASAVQLESPYAFGEYVGWARTVLSSRGIKGRFLTETVEDISAALERLLEAEGFARLKDYFLEGLRVSREPTPKHPETTPTPFMQAILLGDRRAATTIAVEQLRAGASLLEVYQDVIVAAITLIGQLWETNRITVADEHTATEVIKHVVARVYEEAVLDAPPVRGKAILTGVPGEHHQLGARMVADLWELLGLKVRYLGTDLPVANVVATIEQEKPRLVGVSVTLAANVGEAVRLISAIRERWSERELAIIIGGRGFAHLPAAFFQTHGVQARAADLKQAVALARGF